MPHGPHLLYNVFCIAQAAARLRPVSQHIGQCLYYAGCYCATIKRRIRHRGEDGLMGYRPSISLQTGAGCGEVLKKQRRELDPHTTPPGLPNTLYVIMQMIRDYVPETITK